MLHILVVISLHIIKKGKQTQNKQIKQITFE